jgi:hypothetical protein
LGFYGIFRIIFLKKKGIENKRRGLGVKLFSKINSKIISLRKKD